MSEPACKSTGHPRHALGVRLYVGAAILLVGGCYGEDANLRVVRGSVTVNGNPVPTGQVTFVTVADGISYSGPINSEGQYELKARPGESRIGVIALREVQAKPDENTGWQNAFAAPSQRPYVPSQYGNPDASPLKYTVSEEEPNTFDIAITVGRSSRR